MSTLRPDRRYTFPRRPAQEGAWLYRDPEHYGRTVGFRFKTDTTADSLVFIRNPITGRMWWLYAACKWCRDYRPKMWFMHEESFCLQDDVQQNLDFTTAPGKYRHFSHAERRGRPVLWLPRKEGTRLVYNGPWRFKPGRQSRFRLGERR